MYWSWAGAPLVRATISRASSSAPAPPSAQWFARIAFTCTAVQPLRITASSSSVSPVKWLMATTTGRPQPLMFSTCFRRFPMPFSTAWALGAPRASLGTPPCIFRARTVATSTTASGEMFAWRHLMSMNFSAPRSAPKPASVTVYSLRCMASLVAMRLLQPWAMLPKGPPCTKAGLCSRVWTRLGLMASLRRAAMAPFTFRSAMVTGFLS